MKDAKSFDAWNKVKKNIHKRAKVPSIREGEIWWFADGQNVGVEINGKGERFARPVLVLTKFGKLSFFGVPLTSKKHQGSWYSSVVFKDKTEYAALCQAKALSIHRLYRKMGMLPSSDLEKVRTSFIALHSKKCPQSFNRGIAGIPEDSSIIAKLFAKIKAKIKSFLQR
ncbi:type II toxin-antitoxin system PemK/MazF family toxin [Candidatus Saccharibacteria bacterium]|nr:type II toxin-antitoxin system PemK/MazF family toxin [Candidatus Saccharibacteria bacterium]